ncbi:MAG: aldehyde dehydrogenase (NADP(+)) [Fluviicola sp. XM-24bin1]|nr:MAG: aldehyde dehydrogenase (NADP(+)) [Fluviicola sp. XM-24bin1]
MITGKSYIGFSQQSSGSTTYKTINPKLNLENEWVFTEATSEEIDEAINMAWIAFKAYRNISESDRAKFLNAIADEIEALGDDLVQMYCAESGLPEGRANGERNRTVFQLRSFAEMLQSDDWKQVSIDTAIPDRTPAPKPDLRRSVLPLGPVAVFGSSNFPLAYSTAGGDTASALAVGCPVVVKSHPMHAGTGELIAGAIVRAAQATGMPEGVFSNLNSKGIEVGQRLVKHPKIKAVGFTGSIRGGRALLDLAAQRTEPIPVFAEMGSINPVVITQNALEYNGSKWAETYAGSITLGTGQFCTNPGLILGIKSRELTSFTEELAEKIVTIDPMVMLHPNIKSAYGRMKSEVTGQSGVSVLSAPLEVETNYADQAVATVDGSAFLSNPKLHTEVFGPFSIVVQCEDEAQLLEIIENLEGQLTGTIIAEDSDLPNLHTIVDEMRQRVGRLIFNGVPTGVEVCPSMNHGGPYPSSTDPRFTAVGMHSVRRWVRLISYQNMPESLLPNELQNG